MNDIAEAQRQIRIDKDGLTVGGERVPGLIENVIVVQKERGGLWTVSVKFLTNVPPVTAAGLIDEPIETRVIRPATTGDD